MIVSPQKAAQALVIFDLTREELTPATLKGAYRTKAKECHPDYHGTNRLKEWSDLSWAKVILDELVKREAPAPCASTEIANTGDCRACGGSGRVDVRTASRFGKPLTMQCVMCEGMGTILPREKTGD